MVPNFKSEIEALVKKYPEEWRNAHTGNAHTEDFVRIVAFELNKKDKKVGLNGKRGNPEDISDDVINYKGEGLGHDPTDGDKPVTVVDFIVGAGGPNPSVGWQVIDQAGPGAWVKPTDPKKESGPAQPKPVTPPVPALKSRDQFYKELQEVNAFYASSDGLKRYGGMVINDSADVEALGKWGYDLMLGKTVEQCKAEIRESFEWKAKH